MTSPSVSSELYGPVRDDVGKVDDLITALRPKDFPFLCEHPGPRPRGGRQARAARRLRCSRASCGTTTSTLLVPLAASIELLHTGDAGTRRRDRRGAEAPRPADGERAVQQRATVMVGDYMFAHAAELVARTGNIDVIRLFAAHADADGHGRAAAGHERLRVRRTTRASTSTASTARRRRCSRRRPRAAAWSPACPDEQMHALRDYGENVGMAFQIVDDILDFTATRRRWASRSAAT